MKEYNLNRWGGIALRIFAIVLVSFAFGFQL